MSDMVYINGAIVPKEKASVGVFDRGLMYGDGIFETIRVYTGVPFQWRRHMDRMLKSAGALKITSSDFTGGLRESTKDLLRANELEEAYLRVTMTRGAHSGSLDLEPSTNPTIIMVADRVRPPSESEYENGVNAITLNQTSISPLARHKTLSYLPYLLARDKARLAGAREALLSGPSGRMAEGTTSNLFVVIAETVLTPPADGRILPGIARAIVLELMEKNGVRYREDYFGVQDVLDADEVFITNSIVEVLPVTKVNDTPINRGRRGPLTSELIDAYREEVERDIRDGS